MHSLNPENSARIHALSQRVCASPRRLGRKAAAVLVGAVVLSATGCTKFFADKADKAAYGVISQKQRLALGQKRAFNIEYDPVIPDTGELGPEPTLLRGRTIPTGSARPRVLSLSECLEIAVRNSRSYQTSKETLYVSALALANMRHDWSLVSGDISAEADWEATGRGGETTKSGSGEMNLSFAQQFANGGVLTLAVGLDVATTFLGIKGTTFGSLIEANLTQPLWQGAWRGFAYEDLYRAERDFAYAILEYERLTQTFATDIATKYYSVLQRRDTLNNDLENLRRLNETFKFTRAQVEAGMISRVQADQAEQNVLNSSANVERSRQGYRDTLDEFKLTLGLPIIAAIELDQHELTQLSLLTIPFGEAQAIDVAMRARPDVLIQRATIRDAARDVEIAADQFNPRVDLILDVSAPGTAPRQPFRTQFYRHTRSAGITFDYSLDQTDNRDDYRNAMIDLEKSRRDLSEFLDTVKLDVRSSYRTLLQSRKTYEIQKTAVELAVRRAKLVRREQKENLASTRDVLEAEDALRQSRNSKTAALVSYTTTRLNFLARLGMISVGPRGSIHERNRPFSFDEHLRPEKP